MHAGRHGNYVVEEEWGWSYITLYLGDSMITGYGSVAEFLEQNEIVAVAFEPHQIKSIDNDGTWDADDVDIRSNPYDRIKKKVGIDDVIKCAENCSEAEHSTEWLYNMTDEIEKNKKWALGNIKISDIEYHTVMKKEDLIEFYADWIDDFPPVILTLSKSFGIKGKPKTYFAIDGSHRIATLVLSGVKKVFAYYPIE